MSTAPIHDSLTQPLRFGAGGRFDLRPAEYRLLIDGQPATLGSRALDLLLVLAAQPGQLLTKNQLLDRVWPGVVVEENNLRVQVNALRRLLGEDAISTVPGRGYRLSAPVFAAPEPALPAVRQASTAEAAVAMSASPPVVDDTGALARPGYTGLGASAQPRLIGRDTDLDRLQSLLFGSRGCITLVGTPGVGKSSLARAAQARWTGPSAWVDLAPLAQSAQVAGSIARAMGLQVDEGRAAEQLLQAIGDRPMLLVLDNAEHLIETCASWAQQLSAAVALRLLVTSQLPLGVSGEQVLRIEPLALPDASAEPRPDQGALALLIERILAADQRYVVTPALLPQMASVCRQLDGLPLALEMAAARVPLMGLKAVHDALAERFALLSRGRRDSPARHRTLHDALDWSYQLLSPAEQHLFRTLGVFAGGFTLDLAVTLTADEHIDRWDVVDGLATLAERSLVSVSGSDPPRYRLLETMRAFALARLAGSEAGAEQVSLRRRHATALLALFSDGGPEALHLAEMENMRDAFMWARSHDLSLAAKLSGLAVRETAFTVWRQEVTDWMLSLQAQMEQPEAGQLPQELQATWWSRLAFVLNVRRVASARPAAERSVALWRPLDNPGMLLGALGHWVRAIAEPGPELDAACAELQQVGAGLSAPDLRARMLGALAQAERVRGDTRALLACREQELQLALEAGWPDMAQAAECNVCDALIRLGREAEAVVRARALLERVEASGADSAGNLPWTLNILVEALTADGQISNARWLLPRSLAASRQFGTTVAWQGALGLMLAERRFKPVARLIGHLQRLWSAAGATPDLDDQHRLASCLAAVQACLGVEAAATLVAEGRLLGEAAAEALAAAIEA